MDVLLRMEKLKNIFIQPASGDAGGSIGAALAAHHIYFEKDRVASENDRMEGSYLGPEFSEKEVLLMLKKAKSLIYKV